MIRRRSPATRASSTRSPIASSPAAAASPSRRRSAPSRMPPTRSTTASSGLASEDHVVGLATLRSDDRRAGILHGHGGYHKRPDIGHAPSHPLGGALPVVGVE